MAFCTLGFNRVKKWWLAKEGLQSEIRRKPTIHVMRGKYRNRAGNDPRALKIAHHTHEFAVDIYSLQNRNLDLFTLEYGTTRERRNMKVRNNLDHPTKRINIPKRQITRANAVYIRRNKPISRNTSHHKRIKWICDASSRISWQHTHSPNCEPPRARAPFYITRRMKHEMHL